jgi:tripartite-type tricarboxylate transporter receptor subunit TctC
MLWAAFLSTVPLSNAQNYPSKTVRILVGFAPGGSTDLTARLFSQELTRLWGIQVVVDNRPGASGLIAGELTAKAARSQARSAHRLRLSFRR